MKKEIHEYLKQIARNGGKASSANMTREERVQRAKKAIAARWDKRTERKEEVTR
jgi:hypothetical protein